MSLQIRESFINATKGYRYDDTTWYRAFTDDIGRLFRSLQKEYGRCISKVYVDPDAKQVGWVFQKKVEYDSGRGRSLPVDQRFYVREVWVEYREVPES